jgi:hypothetical protein
VVELEYHQFSPLSHHYSLQPYLTKHWPS